MTSGWTFVPERSGDGVRTYALASWAALDPFLDTVAFADSHAGRPPYIWRGQRRADWSLSTSLDREFSARGLLIGTPRKIELRASAHLERFKYAARGRRGAHALKIEHPVEWWALGQHYGLATPLLDWTYSPFAAAYFAFEYPSGADATSHRALFALDRNAILRRNAELEDAESIEVGRMPTLDIVEMLSDDNPRLVSQGGLFTRGPIGQPVEQWVTQAFEGSDAPVLLRVEIPDAERLRCLRRLSRMNISHLSLFPDLGGASRYANLALELEPLE